MFAINVSFDFYATQAKKGQIIGKKTVIFFFYLLNIRCRRMSNIIPFHNDILGWKKKPFTLGKGKNNADTIIADDCVLLSCLSKIDTVWLSISITFNGPCIVTFNAYLVCVCGMCVCVIVCIYVSVYVYSAIIIIIIINVARYSQRFSILLCIFTYVTSRRIPEVASCRFPLSPCWLTARGSF